MKNKIIPVILSLSLFLAGCAQGIDTASVGTGFKTPEAAIEQLVNGVNARDMDMVTAISAAETKMRNYDYIADHKGSLYWWYYDAPSTSDFYTQINIASERDRFNQKVKKFVYSLLLQQEGGSEELLEILLDTSGRQRAENLGYTMEDIDNMLNLDRLPGITIQEVLEVPAQGFKDLYKTHDSEYARNIYACDEVVRRILVFTCGDMLFYCAFDLIRYTDDWFIDTIIEDMFFVGYGKHTGLVVQTTPEQLQSIKDLLMSRDIYTEVEIGSDKVVGLSSTNGLYGLKNKETGAIIVKPSYYKINNFSQGLAFAISAGKFVYLDEDGRVVIELGAEITDAGDFQDGLAQIYSYELSPGVTQNNTRPYHNMGGYNYFGYIDKTGEIIMPVHYLYHGTELFRNDQELSQKYPSSRQPWNDRGTQLVQDASRDYLWGVIDRQGNYVIEPIYDWVNSFHDGWAIASKDKLGFINEYGEVVIDFLFSYVHDFSNGLAAAAVDETFGYINKEGKWVIEPKYDAAFEFNEDGYAVVMPTIFIVSDYEKVKGTNEWNFGYYGFDYTISNYLIINKAGETVFSAEQLVKSENLPDSFSLMEEFLSNPQRETKEYSGTLHRQIFENQIVSNPYTGKIYNAKDNDEGILEITYEYAPLDVIEGTVK